MIAQNGQQDIVESGKDFVCRKCKNVAGQTDGRSLVVGDCEFFRTVTFFCTKCGYKNVWRAVFAQEKRK